MVPVKSDSASAQPASRQVQRIYNWLSPIYGFWGSIFESRAHRRILEVVEPRFGESVLEVAVGGGEVFAALRRTKALNRCIGIELSAGMLRRARRRLGPGSALCRADVRQLPFANEIFDVILNCYLLESLSDADIRRALAEFHRVLKPSGRLVLLTMIAPAWPLDSIWMWLFRNAPLLVGACRPVVVTPFLMNNGWQVSLTEQISQNGFRSQLIRASPVPVAQGLANAKGINALGA